MILNKDCLKYLKDISSNFIDCIVTDPPFGISESKFKNQYNRDDKKILSGYVEAPEDFEDWSYKWIKELYRVIKKDGNVFIIISYNNLHHILNNAYKCGFILLNHIIWKYSFGVYCKNKFVCSHYHILRFGKTKKVKFYKDCRFDTTKEQYNDMEDVWFIKKEYSKDTIKNINKLPDELIRKILLYTTKENDNVLDIFLGNFTTYKICKELKRNCFGCEINPTSFNHFITL